MYPTTFTHPASALSVHPIYRNGYTVFTKRHRTLHCGAVKRADNAMRCHAIVVLDTTGTSAHPPKATKTYKTSVMCYKELQFIKFKARAKTRETGVPRL